jgi:uncharacterized phage protein (TIGR01671 family)
MNREIKFRGKRLANDEWCYGSLLVWANGECTILEKSDSSNAVWKREIDPNTVGQFTGLYDKNGKEIYEGDILMCIGQREDNKGRKYFRKVSFKNGSFCMSVPEYNIDSYLNNHIVNGKLNWEVIGNIYDNKELLEETK